MKAVKNGTYKIIEGQQSNTNCLINIPNDINLELNNGSLILKAGSKVYVPNGFKQDGTTRKFDVVTVQNDITIVYGSVLDNLVLAVTASGTVATLSPINNVTSGTSAPSSTSGRRFWYDTTNNVINTYPPGSSSIATTVSFPIAIVNCIAESTFEIKQVFNGFGYIGSIIFAVPQISGLIPDGKNVDGSFKCTNAITTVVIVRSFTSATQGYIRFARNQLGDGNLFYNPKTNFNYVDSNYSSIRSLIIIGRYDTDSNGKITSMTIKSVQPETIPIYRAIKAYEKGEYYGN